MFGDEAAESVAAYGPLCDADGNLCTLGDACDGDDDNAEGTGLLMNHVRRAKSFLYVSSLAAYSEIPDNGVPRKETDAQGCHQRFAPSFYPSIEESPDVAPHLRPAPR